MTTAEAKERLGSLFWIAILIRRGEAPKEQEELLDEIIAELLALDAQSASILLYRYRWRLPFKDIAREINYSVAQTRRLHDAALEKYRKAQERKDENV